MATEANGGRRTCLSMLARLNAIIVGILLAAGLAQPAVAEVVREFDLRKAAQDEVQYYVVLCARDSPAGGMGHAFVVWIEQDERTGNTRSMGYGFYPGASDAVLRLFIGKGKVIDEATKSSSVNPLLLTHRLIVRVDRDQYLASVAVKEKWERSARDFNLMARNCMHFVYDVDRAIGLSSPKPNLFEAPPRYFDRMMTAVPPKK